MAPHHRNQVGVLLTDRLVPIFPAPLADRRQRAGVTALCRYLAHDGLAFLRLAPYVAEAEKGERRAIRFRMCFPIRSFEAEVDEARLVGMERKLVPSETLAQNAEDPLGVEEVLKRHHGIVGESDKGASPLEPRFHLVIEPLIQHMMQENVREVGRDDALNAKDNFQFERKICGWQRGQGVLDLRRKG